MFLKPFYFMITFSAIIVLISISMFAGIVTGMVIMSLLKREKNSPLTTN
jgi:hypothetical protein